MLQLFFTPEEKTPHCNGQKMLSQWCLLNRGSTVYCRYHPTNGGLPRLFPLLYCPYYKHIMYTHICTGIYVCMYVCMYVCTHTHCTCMYADKFNFYVCIICMYVCMYVHISAHSDTCTCMYKKMQTSLIFKEKGNDTLHSVLYIKT